MPNHSSWTSTLASTSAATGFINPIAGSLASLNSRAGSWDAQAQGITLVAAVAVALGAAAWGLWMVLRKPLSAFYSPRSWFISSSAQPPAPSLAAAAAPFLHLPPLAGPTGEANVATHVQSSVLGVSAVGAVISLGAFLPLIIAGVPHLSESSPSNSLGGRLGSLTDLSILRLLNAIPPPGTQTSLVRRATASVASLGSAHTRLIILVILSGVVWVGAGLFILRRIHNKLLRYTEDFEDACAGQEMVFVPNQPSWDGKSEAAIKSSLSGLCNTGREYITGVFSVG
jgi:hypothetical protein